MKHIVSFSGGKDSTAMLLMMLERGMQVDEIIYCNVMATPTLCGDFPEMYEYIRKIEDYTGRKVTFVQAEISFEEQFYTEYKRGERAGQIYGFPFTTGFSWCNDRLKLKPLRKYQKQAGDHITYLGIAADEPRRLAKMKENTRAPLAEWGITEAMAREYLEEKGLLNPLYRKFNRLGCWFCPKQRLASLRAVREEYPDFWRILLQWQEDGRRSFRPERTMFELEKRFHEEDKKEGKKQRICLDFTPVQSD